MQLLDQREVAEITGESTRTWERRRAAGDGPAYYRLGRSIRYDRDEVLEWVRQRRRQSTSEPERRVPVANAPIPKTNNRQEARVTREALQLVSAGDDGRFT
jgi:predicted DNA-binding transcriptional regulator AlpA